MNLYPRPSPSAESVEGAIHHTAVVEHQRRVDPEVGLDRVAFRIEDIQVLVKAKGRFFCLSTFDVLTSESISPYPCRGHPCVKNDRAYQKVRCRKISEDWVHSMMGVHQRPNSSSAAEKAPSMIW
jgi:hypothetical protein